MRGKSAPSSLSLWLGHDVLPSGHVTIDNVSRVLEGRHARKAASEAKRAQSRAQTLLDECERKFRPLLQVSKAHPEHVCIVGPFVRPLGDRPVPHLPTHDEIVNGLLVPAIVTRGGQGMPSSLLAALLDIAESNLEKKAPSPFRLRHIANLRRMTRKRADDDKDTFLYFGDLLPPQPVVATPDAASTGKLGGKRPRPSKASDGSTTLRLAETAHAVPLDAICGFPRRSLPDMYHDLCYQLFSDIGLRALASEGDAAVLSLFSQYAAESLRVRMAKMHLESNPKLDNNGKTTVSAVDALTAADEGHFLSTSITGASLVPLGLFPESTVPLHMPRLLAVKVNDCHASYLDVDFGADRQLSKWFASFCGRVVYHHTTVLKAQCRHPGDCRNNPDGLPIAERLSVLRIAHVSASIPGERGRPLPSASTTDVVGCDSSHGWLNTRR